MSVTDKSIYYEDYELVTSEIQGYPTAVDEIDSKAVTIMMLTALKRINE